MPGYNELSLYIHSGRSQMDRASDRERRPGQHRYHRKRERGVVDGKEGAACGDNNRMRQVSVPPATKGSTLREANW